MFLFMFNFFFPRGKDQSQSDKHFKNKTFGLDRNFQKAY